jgi:hypothetical protein
MKNSTDILKPEVSNKYNIISIGIIIANIYINPKYDTGEKSPTEIKLINKEKQTTTTINVKDKAVLKLVEPAREFYRDGGRRIKKRTRRHKKKRGNKTRRKRTRGNRSNH